MELIYCYLLIEMSLLADFVFSYELTFKMPLIHAKLANVADMVVRIRHKPGLEFRII